MTVNSPQVGIAPQAWKSSRVKWIWSESQGKGGKCTELKGKVGARMQLTYKERDQGLPWWLSG